MARSTRAAYLRRRDSADARPPHPAAAHWSWAMLAFAGTVARRAALRRSTAIWSRSPASIAPASFLLMLAVPPDRPRPSAVGVAAALFARTARKCSTPTCSWTSAPALLLIWARYSNTCCWLQPAARMERPGDRRCSGFPCRAPGRPVPAAPGVSAAAGRCPADVCPAPAWGPIFVSAAGGGDPFAVSVATPCAPLPSPPLLLLAFPYRQL